MPSLLRWYIHSSCWASVDSVSVCRAHTVQDPVQRCFWRKYAMSPAYCWFIYQDRPSIVNFDRYKISIELNLISKITHLPASKYTWSKSKNLIWPCYCAHVVMTSQKVWAVVWDMESYEHKMGGFPMHSTCTGSTWPRLPRCNQLRMRDNGGINNLRLLRLTFPADLKHFFRLSTPVHCVLLMNIWTKYAIDINSIHNYA